MRIIWKPQFDIGIEAIDGQHRQLVTLINHISADQRHDRVFIHLEELSRYATQHFLDEENLMKQSIPRSKHLIVHVQEHRQFWRTVMDYRARYDEGDTTVGAELLEFINNWFLVHTQTVDRQMAREMAFAKENVAAARPGKS